MSKSAAKFQTFSSKGFEDLSKKVADLLDPNYTPGNTPYYSTGGRTLIKLGGTPLGVAQSFVWKLSYSGQTINTIDASEPWDIDVGRLNISGTLSNIIDPTKGPEADLLFATMKAAVHQPLVEIQCLDSSGTSVFFARGMFIAVSGSIGRGQLSNGSAEFLGVAFQHYCAQNFQPYSGVTSSADKISKNLKGLISNVSGGIL